MTSDSLRSRVLAFQREAAAWAPTAARWILAAVVFGHGAQKLLGWWGGYGLEGTLGYFTGTIGLPWLLALGVILLEAVGPLFLALGLFARSVSAGLIAVMLGAIATVHGRVGFFMNWSGQQGGEGYEFHLLVIGLALTVLLAGPGRLALRRPAPRA